ncbi:hypothetical protein AK812_SmicGene10303 [Symbiodinium microadriaticum]|uniref:Uncharacterized protein n=1 Tax=Symbiodinium microadriaticum TaxID=2951 RepID=A0A1Q9EG54_SYMMI|nr:hypothetical protein AK812_SmicGene10303 [Symbiodinium microadriaticum]CAE6951510.1 unnamed protein product [Symbiodinium sp. KB8]CAE7232181.1 unnamed protein product [Symbiodinium microadriaticum]
MMGAGEQCACFLTESHRFTLQARCWHGAACFLISHEDPLPIMRRRGEDTKQPGKSPSADECLEGVSSTTSSSLQTFVRTLAHPQRSAVLVLALSLVAVGIQTWDEDVVLSRLLVLIGLFIAPAAVGRLPPPSEVFSREDMEGERLVAPASVQAPEAMTMDAGCIA